MAPRSDRRPGFSRRAQYSIFTGYVLAVLGAGAGLVLLIVSVVDPGSFAFLRRGAAEAAAPLGVAGSHTRTASRGFFAGIGDYFQAASQNASLRREVDMARARQVETAALAQENRRLKALLGVIERDGKPVAAARLIASTTSSTRRFATIDAGARQGVSVRQPIRSATGLIGRVLEVGPDTARVLLVTDPENVVPIRRASDGVAAFSQGRSDGRLVVKLINMGINPLKIGDVFVTSGSGGLYRPNIPVAVVETLTRDGAIARIVSDPAAADFVIVDPVFVPLPEPTSAPARPVVPGEGAAP